jgi:hypothetical protein
MLCSRQKPLNASATADSLPDTHHEHPSRAAGSFFGQRWTLKLTRHRVRIGSGAPVRRSGIEVPLRPAIGRWSGERAEFVYSRLGSG